MIARFNKVRDESMKKNLLLALLVMTLSLAITACSKKEEAKDNNTISIVDNDKALEAVNDSENESVVEPEEEEESSETQGNQELGSYADFAGSYSFASGVGAWATGIEIDESGAFTGDYHDSDMGDIGEDHLNGTCYISKFRGHFSELIKVDDFTYEATIDELEVLTPTGTESIDDEVLNIYTEPYGIEDYDVLVFYLPGKKVTELDDEFLSWTSLRYEPVYPSELIYKSIHNVKMGYGFECYDESATKNGTIKESLSVDDYSMLAGRYEGDNGSVMNISVFSDISDDGNIGNISWLEDENTKYQPEAKLMIDDRGGYTGQPEYTESYRIIVTDNTDGAIVLELCSENGFCYATFKMVEHYES